MFKISFLKRVYFSYVIVILVTTLAIGVLVAREVEKNAVWEIDNTLQIQASMLAEIAYPELLLGNYVDLQSKIHDLGLQTRSRLTILDGLGKVIADSSLDPVKMDNHGTRPEVLQALQNNFGRASRYSDTLKQQMRYIALIVRNENKPIGAVRVSLPLTRMAQKLTQLKQAIFLGALVAAIVGLIIGLFFARRFSGPILSITEGAVAIAQGDFQKRIWVKGDDEISKLANSFNYMADESARRVDQLIADKNKLATILSGMVEGVIAVDQNQQIIHINEAAANILGVSANASVGIVFWEVIRIDEINKILQKVQKQHQIIREKVQIAGMENDRVVGVYCASISDHSDKNGAILVLNDMSELHRLETVRQDFVANASHELKTPITVINGVVETILDDKNMPRETLYNFLEKAHLQTHRLSHLVSDLMTISRLERAADVLSNRIEILPLLQQVIKSFRPVAHEKNIQLDSQFPDISPVVMADPQLLNQVFDNLIDNAIKYTAAYGAISLSLDEADKMVVITVEDSGFGISKEDQLRIFERFYRVDKGRSRALGSTGLGLAIVKHIVEQHGGKIIVESERGKGSKFKVFLPRLK